MHSSTGNNQKYITTAFSKLESHAIPDLFTKVKEEDFGVLVVGFADHQHPKPLF
jgi:hypothetical protein